MTGPSPRLIAFVDPMCSWCYGFSPVLRAITKTYGATLPIALIMGGLRPGTTRAMTDDDKVKIRGHWEHVAAASGQPFDYGFFQRDGFVYDTDPAARAVVLMRGAIENLISAKAEDPVDVAHGAGFPRPHLALDFLEAIQRAFYAENRDVTQIGVLAEIASHFGVNEPAFMKAMASEAARNETWTDYGISQRTGATGFPTLIAGYGDERPWVLVTKGYQPAEAVLANLAGWLGEPIPDRQPQAGAEGAACPVDRG
ncbi:MAG: DsbA family protein [Proteobacteria bacterium]|nr:DsbA family protein [Pseudomonadota bacterium]